MRIHQGMPIALADSSAKSIDAEPSSGRRDFLQVRLYGSLAALCFSVAGCAAGKIRPTPLPPNRMKGGGGRGGASAASHR
jgi:hypothetical protein